MEALQSSNVDIDEVGEVILMVGGLVVGTVGVTGTAGVLRGAVVAGLPPINLPIPKFTPNEA